MNSLLQFLWSVRELRRAVYAMPTEGDVRTYVYACLACSVPVLVPVHTNGL